MALTGWGVGAYLTRAVAVYETRPLLISAWLYRTSVSTSQSRFAVSTGVLGSGDHSRRLGASKTTVAITERSTSGSGVDSTTPTPLDVWFHAAAWFVSESLREIEVDATGLVQNTAVRNLDAGDVTRIGILPNDASPWPEDCAIAEVTFWDGSGMTEANRRALVAKFENGENPKSISEEVGQPWSGKGITYWLDEDNSLVNLFAGAPNTLTMVGVLSAFASHPPVAPFGGGPATIGDLVATAVSGTHISLTHTAAAGSTAHHYHRSAIQGFLPSGTTPGTGTCIAVKDETSTGYEDESVPTPSRWYYKVVATDGVDTTPSNEASAYGPELGMLVLDLFDRELVGSWGTADVGGEYTPSENTVLSVAGGTGLMTFPASDNQNVVLPTANGLHVRGRARFSVDKLPTSGHNSFVFYGRRDETVADEFGLKYDFRVRIGNAGVIELRIEKEVDGIKSFVTDALDVVGFVYAGGEIYICEWEAIGTSGTDGGTSLRLRVYPEAEDPVPAWQIDELHNEPALDIFGATGIRCSPSGASTNFPIEFSIYDLLYETARNLFEGNIQVGYGFGELEFMELS